MLMSGETETLDIARLEPYPNEHRLRVGKVLILFPSTDQLLFIFKAGFRGDVYKS
jgi:mRNA interferase RelE/StbE